MDNKNLYAILAAPGDYSAAGRADLPGWKQDMDMMEKALTEGLSFPAQQIRILGQDGRCGVRDFVRETAGLARSLGEEDLLLVYFSGHGSGGNLCFSDAPLDLQSLIDHLSGSRAAVRIVILDCCHAGDFRTGGPAVLTTEDTLAAFTGHGISVLASTDAGERAITGERGSLFTYLLASVMGARHLVRRGRISLQEICRETIRLSEMSSRAVPGVYQHPVWRSAMGGTVFFRVSPWKPWRVQAFHAAGQDFQICRVSPLSTAKTKRLAAFINTDRRMTDQELAEITARSAAMTADLPVFAGSRTARIHQGRKTEVLWCYFGMDDRDQAGSLYYASAVWAASEKLRKTLYPKDRHSRVLDSPAGPVCLTGNISYSILKDMQAEEVLSEEEYARRLKEACSAMITMGEALIWLYREQENRALSREEFRRRAEPLAGQIRRRYVKAGEMPLPAPSLRDLWETADETAGCIADLAINTDRFCETGDAVRRWLLEDSIRRYYEAIERLAAADSE